MLRVPESVLLQRKVPAQALVMSQRTVQKMKKSIKGFGLDAVQDALTAALVTTGILRRRFRIGRDMSTLIGRAVAATRHHIAWKFTSDSVVHVQVAVGKVKAEVPLCRNHEAGNYVRQHQIRYCYEVTPRPRTPANGYLRSFDNVTQKWDYIRLEPNGKAWWKSSGRPLPCWRCVECGKWRPMECGCHTRTGDREMGCYKEGEYWCVHLHQGTPSGWLCQECHVPLNQPK